VDGRSLRSCEPGRLGRREEGAEEEPADHALGYSRGGFGTKFHLLTDSNGIPLHVELSAGQAHESRFAERVLDGVRIRRPRTGRPRQRPRRLAGDKAYSSKRIRNWLRRRHIVPVIPTRADEVPNHRFDRVAYRRRNVVERCVGWLKGLRRIGTRFEKLAVNYLAMLHLGMIRVMLTFE